MDKKRLVDGTTALAEKQPRVIKIEPAEQTQNVRLRVAAYTRVSSDSEDQLNSFAAQNRYYTELISGKAEWRMQDLRTLAVSAGADCCHVVGATSDAELGRFYAENGFMSHHYTLGNIKSRTVGDGQHGTARWATDKEIKQTYAHVPFKVREWRSGQNLPTEQGLILGCKGKPQELTALVDSDDIHCLMIGASGIGKTAFFLYPNLEYACASGMSWLALDSKGDLARNYGTIAKNCYGYHVSVIDLRNPTRSDGNNLLVL